MTRARRVAAVFLDIDGVLNHHRFLEARRQRSAPPYLLHQRLDPEAVRRLEALVRRAEGEGFEVRCVLSSTWRLQEGRGLEGTEAALRVHAPSLRLHDQTPDLEPELGLEPPRGLEVQAWLRGHPEVSAFVILDDHDDLEPFVEHLVQVRRAVGLLESDCELALACLRRRRSGQDSQGSVVSEA